MIGCWNSRNGPLLLARVPNERNHCTGRRGWCGGGHWYGPPRGPAPQCLARRPCATWQEARVGGGSRPPGRGFWVTETTRGARRLKDEKSPTYSRDPWSLENSSLEKKNLSKWWKEAPKKREKDKGEDGELLLRLLRSRKFQDHSWVATYKYLPTRQALGSMKEALMAQWLKRWATNQKVGRWNTPAAQREKDVAVGFLKIYNLGNMRQLYHVLPGRCESESTQSSGFGFGLEFQARPGN
ncbi:uncharacterized protein LOC135228494 isoform X1 [Loxodonta africana]|uniref:uncharacterized protein LOC135228494 isoform X1 n=1 Tax=Loxodonta africana TaxID=9785 RepID=UPI0030D56B9D